jgi:hypothetical protein
MFAAPHQAMIDQLNAQAAFQNTIDQQNTQNTMDQQMVQSIINQQNTTPLQ